MAEPQEYLADGTPLITAALLGKQRLVRLLVEGGAQVNERNQQGETPLLAACRALRGDGSTSNAIPASASALRVLRFLLESGADANAQDKAGRTALMYACMEKAGPAVAAALIRAGADPSMEDYAGASALVYAVNAAREQETLRVLLDACRERGRDIIIIATDLSGAATGASPVTRRYLNVPPSPDSSPVSCMSPSEIELRGGGGSPGSENEGGENFFNFRGTGKRGSGGDGAEGGTGGGAGVGGGAVGRHPHGQRLHSEPWLSIHNLAHLRSSYEESLRRATMREDDEKGEEDEEEELLQPPKPRDPRARRRSSLHPYSGLDPCHSDPPGSRTSLQPHPPGGVLPHLGRRNTLSCLQDTPLLQLPSLTLNHAGSDTYLQAPPPGAPALGPGRGGREQYSSTWSLVSPDRAPAATDATGRKTSFLPPLPTSCPAAQRPAGPHAAPEMPPRPPPTRPRQEGRRGRRLQRRHSVQLEPAGQVDQVEQVGSSEEILIL